MGSEKDGMIFNHRRAECKLILARTSGFPGYASQNKSHPSRVAFAQ